MRPLDEPTANRPGVAPHEVVGQRLVLGTLACTTPSRTSPALSVLPGAIVSRRFTLNAKSPASAGDTAYAETVTVTSSAVTRLRLRRHPALATVLRDAAPGANTRVTVGAPSSSVIVSVYWLGRLQARRARRRRADPRAPVRIVLVVVHRRYRYPPRALRPARRNRQLPVRAPREVVRVRRRHRRRRDTVTVTSPVVAPLSCAVTRLSPPSSEIRSGAAPASRSAAPRRLRR